MDETTPDPGANIAIPNQQNVAGSIQDSVDGADGEKRNLVALKDTASRLRIYKGILDSLFMCPDFRKKLYEAETSEESVTWQLQVLFLRLQFGAAAVDPTMFYDTFDSEYEDEYDEGNGRQYLKCILDAIDNDVTKSTGREQYPMVNLFRCVMSNNTSSNDCGHASSEEIYPTDLAVFPSQTMTGRIETLLSEISLRKRRDMPCTQCDVRKMVVAETEFKLMEWPYILAVHVYGRSILPEDLSKHELFSVMMLGDRVRVFIKDLETKMWYSFGSWVNRVSFDEVKECCLVKGKYMLMYREMNPGRNVGFPTLNQLPDKMKALLGKLDC